MKSVRNGRIPFFLALGYLIWGALPHAAFRVHEHAGGAAAHSHLSYHDLDLRNGTLVTANPAEIPGSPDREPAGPADEAMSATATMDVSTGVIPSSAGILKSTPSRHGHFTEDDNILATGLALAGIPVPEIHPRVVPAHALSPLLSYSGPATARGPPARA